MIDLLLVALLLVVLYRGYRRGFVRELADLLLVVVGLVVAFRTGDASAAFFGSWTGASPVVSRMIGGFAVFFLIQLGGSVLLRRALPRQGALRAVDRIAGMAMSGAWFAVGVTMLLLVASAVPLGERSENYLEDSRVAEFVAGENSAAKDAVSAIVGDRILEALVNLNQFIGDNQVVIEGEQVIELPETTGDLLEARAAAEEVFELLNLKRINEGLDPLAWSGGLAEVAAGHGFEMYRQGYFSHVSPETGTVGDRIQATGVPYRLAGENLALSPTPQSVHEGLLASPSHKEIMLDGRFTRVGISAIDGPLGLMVVQVFTG